MIKLKNGEYTYSKSDYIGGGSFGQVYKCKSRSRQGKTLAVKIMSKTKLDEYEDYLWNALEREINIQKRVTKSGVPFYVFLYDDFRDSTNVYLIMELCSGGSLHKLLKKQLSEQEILGYILQVGIGLLYLHSIGITHRDIKPENVLIQDGVMKIADFGFANNSSDLTTNLGTKPYMSPELFNEREELYSEKIDV